VGCIVGNQ